MTKTILLQALDYGHLVGVVVRHDGEETIIAKFDREEFAKMIAGNLWPIVIGDLRE